ncbi:MAG: HEAT repeat domain-containing protein [Anaerolineae bacterium]|nr:HEAT repeat domain-containing protein [Anaerolineae bacterium]
MSQAEITARQQQIERLINMLASSNWRDRRDAASMLGELAADSAVDELISVYLNDSNVRVRDAAAYALGQFRAVDAALQAGKEEKVTKLLTRVEIEGKIGQRRRIGRWVKTALALTLSCVALFALYSYLPSGVLSNVVPTIERPIDYAAKAAAAGQIRPMFNQLRDNLTTLQSQFQAVLGGGAFDCQAYFNDLQPGAFSQVNVGAFPDLAQVVTLLNDILSREQEARQRFDAACYGAETLDAQSVGPVYGMIVPAVQALPAADDILRAAESAHPLAETDSTTEAPAAQIEVTLMPTVPQIEATLMPTVPPTLAPPTREIVIVDPDTALRNLLAMSDSLTAPRGAGSLILQYWTDAGAFGQTQGCNDLSTPAQIPSNYELPADVAQAVPQLSEAARLINEALTAIRTSWMLFGGACQTGNLTALADSQIAELNLAMGKLGIAEQLLTMAQNS